MTAPLSLGDEAPVALREVPRSGLLEMLSTMLRNTARTATVRGFRHLKSLCAASCPSPAAL